MTSFQRMIAIPQEEYLQLSTLQNIRQPLSQQVYKLENEHNELRNIEDPYKRLMLQSETINEMKELKDKMRSYLTISTPKPYRSRAQALFESIESFIKFNERGEIKDKSDNVIENSRLEDLIQHAVRDRRRYMKPIGWSTFLNILKEHNVPKSTLNKDTLDEMDKMSHSAKATSSHTSKLPLPVMRITPKDTKRLSRSRFRSEKQRKRRTDSADLRYKPRKSLRYPSTEFLKDF